jgi:tripartite ATP-independent transporter DctM subunit
MSRASARAGGCTVAAIEVQRDHRAIARSGVLDGVALCVEAIVVAAIVVNIVVTFGNALVRFIFEQDFPWAADIWRILISMITFLGAPAYFRRTNGMAYTALIDMLKGSRRQTIEACGLVIFLCVCVTVLVPYGAFFTSQIGQSLPILGINSGFVAIWLGIGLALMSVFTIEKLSALKLRAVLNGAVVPLAMAVAIIGLRWAYTEGHVAIDPFILIVAALVVAFITGVPIGGILALGGMLFFLLTGDAPMVTFPSALQYGIHSYILLAIPFFMLAGTLMEVTGMAKRMIDMVQEWVGHWTGGLLIAQVVGMYIFSGVSGSKAADIATVGSVMKQPLRQYGYPPAESVAVLAAAAAMGETIPPSLALLVLGSITTLSVGSLFVAGIIPATVLAIALIVAVVIRSRIKGFHKGPPFRLGRALRTMPLAIPALMVPVIVVGGIVGGIASPTESASLAVVYAFAVALFVYHTIGWRSCWIALRDATLIAGMILFMIGASNLLSQAIVTDGLGRTLAVAFGALQSPIAFLFVSMFVMIVIGLVLEGLPAILIAAPILLPVAIRFGIEPLQYGMVLCVAMGIGVFMPPVGIGYYVACAIGDAPVNATMRPALIYSMFIVLGLIVVILFPQLTVWLPHHFGMH